jgi:hypothetical protein
MFQSGNVTMCSSAASFRKGSCLLPKFFKASYSVSKNRRDSARAWMRIRMGMRAPYCSVDCAGNRGHWCITTFFSDSHYGSVSRDLGMASVGRLRRACPKDLLHDFEELAASN